MFGLLKDISPALDSDETDTVISEDMFHPAIFGNAFCKFITVLLDSEKYGLFLDDFDKNGSDGLTENDKLFVLYLKARMQMLEGDHANAVVTLREVTDSETAPERLLLYFACADTEVCCREVGDYKGAYEASQNKLEILEHMLVEDRL